MSGSWNNFIFEFVKFFSSSDKLLRGIEFELGRLDDKCLAASDKFIRCVPLICKNDEFAKSTCALYLQPTIFVSPLLVSIVKGAEVNMGAKM